MAPSHVLLLEGQDDLHFFGHLLTHHNVPLNDLGKSRTGLLTLDKADGVEALLAQIPVRIKGSDIRRLGVVVDADANPASRWQSIRDVLLGVGYTDVPVKPESNGTTVTSQGLPTFGIWLMPNNEMAGSLENFAHALVPPADDLWDHVEACVDAIPTAQRRWRASYEMKAKMHTWLAWQEEPGARMGLALRRRYLNADAPNVVPLIAWLRRTFEL